MMDQSAKRKADDGLGSSEKRTKVSFDRSAKFQLLVASKLRTGWKIYQSNIYTNKRILYRQENNGASRAELRTAALHSLE